MAVAVRRYDLGSSAIFWVNFWVNDTG